MNKKLDAEAVLATLAKIRKSLPKRAGAEAPPVPREEASMRVDAIDEEDFEALAVADALSSLADEVGAIAREAQERLFEKSLDIYYAAEELAKQPEHADMIEQVEAMRKAYEKSYGTPIPSKEETLRRREIQCAPSWNATEPTKSS
ncbi:MAG TPA: hypothetical protein VF618_13055 [Thermoanaerobaculia bacterium]